MNIKRSLSRRQRPGYASRGSMRRRLRGKHSRGAAFKRHRERFGTLTDKLQKAKKKRMGNPPPERRKRTEPKMSVGGAKGGMRKARVY